jgi:hypothetical protein
MPLRWPFTICLPCFDGGPREQDRNRASTPAPSRLPDRPDGPSGRLPSAPPSGDLRPRRAAPGQTGARLVPSAPPINLNGAVHVSDEPHGAPDSNTVNCRHFATEYAAAMHKENVLGDFCSAQRVSDRFEGRLRGVDQLFDSLMYERQGLPRNLISGNALGGYLEHVADTLARQRLAMPDAQGLRRAQANILLCSDDHAMALHVQRQQDAAGHETFSASLFDPNRTNDHKTAVAARPGDFAGMKLADFAGAAYAEALAGPGAQDLLMSATSIDARIPPTRAGLIPTSAMAHPATAALALGVAMKRGVVDAIDALSQAVQDAPTAQARMQILAGVREGGLPALMQSMASGQADSIRAYGSLVMAADLALHDKKALLIGQHEDLNVMSIGATNGCMAAMAAHLSNLRQVGVTGPEWITAAGMPESLLLRGGEPAAVLIQGLHGSGLSSQEKVALLTQPVPGCSAGSLNEIAQVAPPEVKAAVLNALGQCGLTPAHLQALVADFTR